MREDLLPTSFEGRIARVIEESGEVIQAIGKIQRFGKEAQDPKTKIKYNNVEDLKEELQHLKHSIKELEDWFVN